MKASASSGRTKTSIWGYRLNPPSREGQLTQLKLLILGSREEKEEEERGESASHASEMVSTPGLGCVLEAVSSSSLNDLLSKSMCRGWAGSFTTPSRSSDSKQGCLLARNRLKSLKASRKHQKVRFCAKKIKKSSGALQ